MKTEYMIASRWSISGLERLVNHLLSNGWTVAGGVAIQYHPADPSTNTEDGWLYAQAMTREVKEIPVTIDDVPRMLIVPSDEE